MCTEKITEFGNTKIDKEALIQTIGLSVQKTQLKPYVVTMAFLSTHG